MLEHSKSQSLDTFSTSLHLPPRWSHLGSYTINKLIAATFISLVLTSILNSKHIHPFASQTAPLNFRSNVCRAEHLVIGSNLLQWPSSFNIDSFLSAVHTWDLGAMLPPLPSPLTYSISKFRSLTFKISQGITIDPHCHLPSSLITLPQSLCFLVLWELQRTSASEPLPCLALGLECSHSLLPHFLWVFMQMSFMNEAISDHPL